MKMLKVLVFALLLTVTQTYYTPVYALEETSAEYSPFNDEEVKQVFEEFSSSFKDLPIAKQLLITVVKYALVIAFILAIVSSAFEIMTALADPTKTVGLFRRISTKWILWLAIGGSLQIANYIFGVGDAIIGA